MSHHGDLPDGGSKPRRGSPSTTFLRALGDAIRESRRERGLHQEQLGARVEIGGSRIGEIERGKVNTSVARVYRLAQALRLPLSALFRRMELVGATPAEIEALRSSAIETLKRLDRLDLDLVAAILRRLVRR